MTLELQVDSEFQLAAWARGIEPSALQRMLMLSAQPGITSFALGLPAAELFPAAALANIAQRLLSTTPKALQYSPDFEALKTQVVELMRRRGVVCHEGQVFLTAGAQQGMDLLARLLLEPGGQVITEELIYTGFQQVLEPFRPHILTAPTNRTTGIDVEAVEKILREGKRPAFIYAIPEGHVPMAVSLALSERSRLVDLAIRYRVPIIEDDAYGFLYYEENPPPPLRALNEQWVFYVGSFSKVMAPALRVGWLVVPETLIQPLSIIKEASDINTTTFSQRLISAFIDDDQLITHINGLVQEYKNRRDTMLSALREHFPGEAAWSTPASGVFIWVELPSGISAEELLHESITKERISFLPGAAFAVPGRAPKTQGLRLNFSNCSPAQIEDGISRLGRLLKERMHRQSSVPGADAGSVVLRYGEKTLPLRFDPQQFTVLEPRDAAARELSDEAIGALLDKPTHGPGLSEMVHGRDHVVIVVPDATRAAGAKRIVALLVDLLNRRGLQDKQISVLIGGGIHRAPTTAEIHSILGVDVSQRLAVHAHDANDEAALVSLGTTTRGTPVVLNRRLVEADHVIVIGAISFHYIAGFSGGRKAILPGCAAERSIKANHLLSFDLETLNKREGVASGDLDGNIVHQDMLEAVDMLNPSFLVNTVLNSNNEIVSVYTGHWRDAHRKGCDEYGQSHAVTVAERRPLVIASVGGAPRDVNLIQSHKAIEHASALLEEGGTLIVLAECGNGLGRDDFLDWFPAGGSRATALKLVENYKINGQTAWSLRRKAERFRIMLVSALDHSVVRQMGLEPVPSLEAALALVKGKPGYIVPYGLTTLPRISQAGLQ